MRSPKWKPSGRTHGPLSPFSPGPHGGLGGGGSPKARPLPAGPLRAPPFPPRPASSTLLGKGTHQSGSSARRRRRRQGREAPRSGPGRRVLTPQHVQPQGLRQRAGRRRGRNRPLSRKGCVQPQVRAQRRGRSWRGPHVPSTRTSREPNATNSDSVARRRDGSASLRARQRPRRSASWWRGEGESSFKERVGARLNQKPRGQDF